MIVVWTRRAEKQLDQIFDYIGLDSSLYAFRIIEKIIEQAGQYPRKKRYTRSISSSLSDYLSY